MNSIKTIMLIDDSESDLYLHQLVIESMGVAQNILTFNSAKKALEYLSKMQNEETSRKLIVPDLIFLDLHMPGMDGFQFLDKFKKLPLHALRSVQIFLLSSTAYPKDIEQAKQNKLCSEFISKPLSERSFSDLLGRHI